MKFYQYVRVRNPSLKTTRGLQGQGGHFSWGGQTLLDPSNLKDLTWLAYLQEIDAAYHVRK